MTEQQYITFSRCALNSIILEPQRTTGCGKLFKLLQKHALADLETCRRNSYVSDWSSPSRSTYSGSAASRTSGSRLSNPKRSDEPRQLSRSWQPDIVGISLAKKKPIAIGPEVSLPSNTRMKALQEAHSRKTQSYGPLIAALQTYVDSGWKVEILSWMVGARGMVRTELLTPALEFLELPKQKWIGINAAS